MKYAHSGFSSLVQSLLPFKNIAWVYEAAVERLTALHYSVDFIFLSFGNMGFIVEH